MSPSDVDFLIGWVFGMITAFEIVGIIQIVKRLRAL
jgi:hypothetical protein